MKNLILSSVLATLLLPACGGEPTQTGSSNSAGAHGASSNEVSNKPEPNKSEPSKPAANSGGNASAKQGKKKKRVRRPRLNMPVVKALLANNPMMPKATVAATPPMVELGKTLYHEQHLSAKGNLSCASCHDLSTYGVDHKPTSPGSTGELGVRNTPTTYNAFRQFRQFWDGRAESVEEQAIMPVINSIEHGLADEAIVVTKIKEKPALVAAFQKAFPGEDDPVTAKNFGVAIGAFERTLVTTSRWDKFLDGDRKALSNEEQQGLKVFMDLNCTQCHMHRTLGGGMYQKLGVYRPYTGKDTGRMQVTGNVADKNMFKVPTLLNVDQTAPYYHDGSIATLEEAVREMALSQLDKKISDEQVASIVTFLKALTGELPAEFRKQ